MADLPVTLDHAVIHVSDWEQARDFYTNVIGAEAVATAAGGYVFRLGAQQLNVHGPGAIGTPVARIPVAPGNSDLCFRWRGKISDAKAHLEAQGIDIELGPVRRFGAMGEEQASIFAIRMVRSWSL